MVAQTCERFTMASYTHYAEATGQVIGSYRMGFELADRAGGATLRVSIEYVLPSGARRILGFAFGQAYARWCTRQMVQDAQTHFARLTVPAGSVTGDAA
jgi:hypothetical protein